MSKLPVTHLIQPIFLASLLATLTFPPDLLDMLHFSLFQNLPSTLHSLPIFAKAVSSLWNAIPFSPFLGIEILLM